MGYFWCCPKNLMKINVHMKNMPAYCKNFKLKGSHRTDVQKSGTAPSNWCVKRSSKLCYINCDILGYFCRCPKNLMKISVNKKNMPAYCKNFKLKESHRTDVQKSGTAPSNWCAKRSSKLCYMGSHQTDVQTEYSIHTASLRPPISLIFSIIWVE